ncbi:hypothetical protein OPIT5_26460 [Opitutaceae bacterium TAV5]|nr:hypothetical protein OPIT5_26460 [Opitutaceae bacterium TAV5]
MNREHFGELAAKGRKNLHAHGAVHRAYKRAGGPRRPERFFAPFRGQFFFGCALVVFLAAGSPGFAANRLADAASPYLRQHADDPVDWQPWNDDTLARARRENRPVFLSSGYSTCHWCHVMRRETFSRADVAAFLNEHFIPVKLDREERPDIDRIYLAFVAGTTGRGGWPLNVWLTPDLKPFLGGTYYPPEDQPGQPGFLTVARVAAEGWARDREKVAAHADRIAAALASLAGAAGPDQRSGRSGAATIDNAAWSAAAAQLFEEFDPEHGGFGRDAKFPHASKIRFLFRFAVQPGVPAGEAARAREVAFASLEALTGGGLRDHLGGGFHRYTVDRGWRLPHFEKMLYDQALVAGLLVDAYQLSGDTRRFDLLRETLAFVEAALTSPDGAFYAALDAESALPGAAEGDKAEGAFYTWSLDEITAALPPDEAALVIARYGFTAEGNATSLEERAGVLHNRNVLVPASSAAATAVTKAPGAAEKLSRALDRLRAIRSTRQPPARDEKIITAWNGYMISALARAHQVTGESRWLDLATRAATHLWQTAWNGKTATLRRIAAPGGGDGFAEDYAAFIQGLLDLYEAGFDPRWLDRALALQATLDTRFADPAPASAGGGGYFGTAAGASGVLVRMKEDFDGAEPAASSLAADNLRRLAVFTGDAAYEHRARAVLAAFAPQHRRAPAAMPVLLAAAFGLAEGAKPRQIVIAGRAGADDTRALLAEARRRFQPFATILLADGASGDWLAQRNEAVAAMRSADGQATAFVCENFACDAPVSDPAALGRLLDRGQR